MGGHSAWRKRVNAGEVAKQGGGAICRHRPHLGRKGKEGLLRNRKGPTCADGGPNKKKKKRRRMVGVTNSDAMDIDDGNTADYRESHDSDDADHVRISKLVEVSCFTLLSALIVFALYKITRLS